MKKYDALSADAIRETYLSDLSIRLRGRLSPLEIFESTQEMRSHIDAMAAAHEELGLDPVDAMKTSLEKFGEAQQVGQQFNTVGSKWGEIRIPIAFVQTFLIGFLLGSLAMLFVDDWFVVTHQFQAGGIRLDIEIGGCFGAIASIFGSIFRKYPIRYGLSVCILVNFFIGLTLYQTYVAIGRVEVFFECAIWMTLCSFALGSITASVSNTLMNSRSHKCLVLVPYIHRQSKQ